MSPYVIPITLFLAIAAIAIFALYYRFKARQELQTTIRAAIEHGRDLSQDAINQLMESLNPPNADLRKGIINVAIGIAFLIFAQLVGEEEAVGPMMGLSAFPFLIGVAYFILSRIPKRREQPDGA